MSPRNGPRPTAFPAVPLVEAPARLGRDLWRLVAGLGAPLVEARVLTALPSPVMGHASYRLRLGDGRAVKGRRVETPAQAKQVAGLVSRLDPRHFPRVLARRGPALLEPWIAGRPLGAAPVGLAAIRRCGRILGAVHAIAAPAGAPEAPAASVAARLGTAERQLEQLAELGALTRAAARAARRQLRDHAPDAAAGGIVHRDFCAENIVVAPGGGLHVVDNETVTIGACEFDLGRTWYRWPMTAPQRTAFLAGYAERRDPAAFVRHVRFWAIAVLADAALFRLLAGTAAPSVPLRRLAALIGRLERGRRGAASRAAMPGRRAPA